MNVLRARWRGRLADQLSAGGRGQKIAALLVLLAALGLVRDGWEAAWRVWQDFHRPVAVYRRGFRGGLAVSLNGLERERLRWLPGFEARGVLLDRRWKDWVLIGEADPVRLPFPVDALVVALRALRLELELPGIDIQPAHDGVTPSDGMQAVRYFGGVEGTVVGTWFFRFDYWMKRASLGEESIPVAGIPVYLQRARDALEQEVSSCTITDPFHLSRRNRYWLCASGLSGIDGDDTFVFEGVPLRVLAESRSDQPEPDRAGSPCVSRGTDDPLAAEFAEALTRHLYEIGDVVPVREIDGFARLLAGFAWLAAHDPYRDLRPWLDASVTLAETVPTVPTLTKGERREHVVAEPGRLVRHEHAFTLRGGVIVDPRVTPARSGDDTLRRLRRTVLAARPSGGRSIWSFAFEPTAS